MKLRRHTGILIFILFLLFACGNDRQGSVHTKSNPPDEREHATEKKPENKTVTVEELKQKINNADGGLHVFVFSEPACQECDSLLHHLQILQSAGMTFSIHAVIIDEEKTELSNINGNFDVYHLKNKGDMKGISSEWTGELPFIIFTSKKTATKLSYQQTFSKDELFVILQSLAL